MRKDRYKDPLEIGPSQLFPFDPSIPWTKRHLDRLIENLHAKREVFLWIKTHGWRMRIHNEDYHWIFEGPGLFAEWWPSTAKLVLNHAYRRGIHVYDWQQLLLVLEGRSGGLPRGARRQGPRRPRGGSPKRSGGSLILSRWVGLARCAN